MIARRFQHLWLACLVVSALLPAATLAASVPTAVPRFVQVRGGVHAIAQHADGYLWLATDAGLLRFDGERYQRFSRAEFPALPSDRIVDLCFENGRLWIATATGLATLHHGGIRRVAGVDRTLFGLACDETGLVLGGHDTGGLWSNRPHDPRIIALADRAKSGTAAPLLGPRGGIWLSARDEGGLFGWLPGSHEAVTITPTDVPEGLHDYWSPVPLHVFKDGTLLASDERGLLLLRGRDLRRVTGPGLAASVARAAPDDTVVLATAGRGVVRVNARADVVEQFGAMPHTSILSLFRDHDGTLWAGTARAGLQRVPGGKAFAMPLPATLTGGSVAVVYPDRDDGVWVSVPCHGISRMVAGREEQRVRGGLRNTCIWAALEHPKGQMWFGSWGGGLVRYDRLQGKITGRWGKKQRLADVVVSLLPFGRDGVWVGAESGLYRLQHGVATKVNVPGLSHVGNLGYDRQGHIWATGPSGAFVWSQGGLRQVSRSDARAIWFAPTGEALISTYGFGLLRYAAGKVEDVTHTAGLDEPFLGQFFPTRGGGLWLTTNEGLFHFDGAAIAQGTAPRFQTSRLTKAAGLPATECNGASNSAGFLRKTGELFVPTARGVGVVRPLSSAAAAEAPPPPQVEAVQLGHRPWQRSGGPLVLKMDAPSLQLTFTELALSAQAAPTFRYRLNDGAWREIGAVRRLMLEQLGDGTHDLQLQARVASSPWSESTHVRVEVLPPWWQTDWFRALVGVLLLLVLLVIARRNWRHTAQVQALVEARTRELAEANLELAKQAQVDSLTGLATRRVLDQHLAMHWRHGARVCSPLAVLMIDIDHFKQLNDRYGHLGGDHCLQEIARRLAQCARRPLDLAARYGGEEFVLVLPNTGVREAKQVAERALAAIHNTEVAIYSNVSAKVTVSIGVAAAVPIAEGSAAALVSAADRALYAAKAQGRDQVQLVTLSEWDLQHMHSAASARRAPMEGYTSAVRANSPTR